jgi:hypothetical protein
MSSSSSSPPEQEPQQPDAVPQMPIPDFNDDGRYLVRPVPEGVQQVQRCQTPLMVSELQRAVQSSETLSPAPGGMLFLHGMNLKSATYADRKGASPEDCAALCHKDKQCLGFVFIETDNNCQMKKSRVIGPVIMEMWRVSGIKPSARTEALKELSHIVKRYDGYLAQCQELSAHSFGHPHHPRVVVSLTTIPSRLNGQLLATIKSVLYGVFRPDAIVLAVPLWSRRFDRPYGDVPPELEHGVADIFHVLRTDEDYGAGTKIIPALTEFVQGEHDVVISVDDDNLYFPWVIGNLLAYSAKYPDRIIAHAGYNIKPNAVIRHPRGLDYIQDGQLTKGPVAVDCFGGFYGVLYKKGFFGDGSLLRTGLFTDYPEGSYVDDDYICGVAGLLGRRAIAVAKGPEVLIAEVPTQSSKENALSSGQNKQPNIERQHQILTRFREHGAFLPGHGGLAPLPQTTISTALAKYSGLTMPPPPPKAKVTASTASDGGVETGGGGGAAATVVASPNHRVPYPYDPSTVALPRLVIIGTEKGGTTQLAYWLSQHPNVMAKRNAAREGGGSECLFLGEGMPARAKADTMSDGALQKLYIRKCFDEPKLKKGQGEMVTFDKTPSYVVFPDAIHNFKRLVPETTHFLISVRDPVARAVSAFRYFYCDHEKSFQAAIDAEIHAAESHGISPASTMEDYHRMQATLMGMPGTTRKKRFHRGAMVAFGLYVIQVREWMEAFPGRVHVSFFDEWKANTDTAALEMDKIFDFMNVPRWTFRTELFYG